ncbi:methyltransferase domain-containing protein [Fomitopsis serialis]|uniref:methyltransferase domain-containing protein n=1 Tax=Fomitopsis serialis TaxID=139415 RepID=UPI0020089FFA|nr:methyltransferase domain-containing protein [Neoantrodia serialis]KAH9921614.1 methyltransferase domain-containing protein [Neoantrodia serialis]
MPFPLTVCQRHPRYAVFLVVLLFGSFLLLSPSDTFSPNRYRYARTATLDHTLPARMERAEEMYGRTLDRRQSMIKKFGPNPSQVVMFPPDRSPWPAYTVWDFFPPVFNCPHESERIGALGDGGKWVCGLSRIAEKQDCVIYSFGLDWDSTFEGELLQRTSHCKVYGYDFTARGFGHGVPRALKGRTHFARLGLGSVDSHGPADEPKMWTLRSLMAANGHDHIDVLHIDIEGWEFEVLRAMVVDFAGLGSVVPGVGAAAGEPESAPERGALPFGQLLIEFHVWHQKFEEFLAFWEMLEGVGLRPFMSEVNLVYANYNRQSGVELAQYSFLNIRGDNVFISDTSSAPAAAADPALDADLEPGEPDVRTIRHAAVAAGALDVRRR